MIDPLQITVNYQLMIHKQITFKKWLRMNDEDLQNLFQLYINNIDGFLSIDEKSIHPDRDESQSKLFNDFVSFIFKNTNIRLKIHSINS